MESLLLDSFELSLKNAGFPLPKEEEYLARGRENLKALYSEIV